MGLDHLEELVENVDIVKRARRGLRMVLDRQHRLAAVTQPLAGAVVQVKLRDFDIAGEAIRVDSVAVVLRRDVYAARRYVLHRVIRAAVPEFELEGAGTESSAKHLVAQADAQYRHLADQRLDRGDLVVEERRIAWPGRKEHA